MDTPKISIIVPVYNAEAVLGRCVDSVLGQDFEDFELLLMDDGSRDGSPEICDRYAKQDSRVRVVHKENSGVSNTRNMAIDMARGEYLQFLDADDWITPEASRLFVRAAEENGADMVISDFYRVVGEHTSRKGSIDEEGLITRNEFADHMSKSPADYYYGVIWNKLFRRSIVEEFHIRMNPELRWCEDFIFNMEYLLHVTNVYVLRVPTYYYVKTEGSLVQQGMQIRKIVRMKLNVIEYYSDFYKKIYDPEEYEAKRGEIYSFLIDYAHDDSAIPGLPGTMKLGRERVTAPGEAMADDLWTDLYYMNRSLDREIELTAQQTGLETRDLKLFLWLRTFGKPESFAETAQYLGVSQIILAAIIERLALKGYLKVELGDPRTAELADAAGPVMEALSRAVGDVTEACTADMTEEERTMFLQAARKAGATLRRRIVR